MTIRAAESGDFDAIAEITNHYISATTIHWNYDPVSADELRRSWGAAATYPFLVAVEPPVERPLGYAKAGPWRQRAAYARTAEVAIYLHPDRVGQRIGGRLYGALIDECRRRGFHALIAGIALPNDASIRLHASLGFVHVGTFVEVGWKFDAWRDVAFYQLLL